MENTRELAKKSFDLLNLFIKTNTPSNENLLNNLSLLPLYFKRTTDCSSNNERPKMDWHFTLTGLLEL